MSMYRIVWEYETEPGRAREFEQAYGPAGAWVGLFREGEGYLGSELFRSAADPLRYLTVDQWTSRAAFEAFSAARKRDYEAIDARCAALTRAERLIARSEEP